MASSIFLLFRSGLKAFLTFSPSLLPIHLTSVTKRNPPLALSYPLSFTIKPWSLGACIEWYRTRYSFASIYNMVGRIFPVSFDLASRLSPKLIQFLRLSTSICILNTDFHSFISYMGFKRVGTFSDSRSLNRGEMCFCGYI